MEFVQCPNCGIMIEILAINCAIFRCGVVKSTGEQIPPHASKEEIEKLDVWGCGKPMRLVDGKFVVCDYI